MKRKVTIVHYGGGRKTDLDAELVGKEKPKTAKVHVFFGHGDWLYFNAMTGLAHGLPRYAWHLSDEDRAFFCKEMGITPVKRSLGPLKGRRPKLKPGDKRQLSLVDRT